MSLHLIPRKYQVSWTVTKNIWLTNHTCYVPIPTTTFPPPPLPPQTSVGRILALLQGTCIRPYLLIILTSVISFVGEVLSFYLSRLIGLDNVPVVVLATTNSSSPQWKATDFSKFEWENNVSVALIQWINGIEDNFR